MFLSRDTLGLLSWQAMERAVTRFLIHDGFSDVRMVGQSNDKGADVLAHKFGKRWLFQIKHWKNRSGVDVIDRTLEACRIYRAQVPVIICIGGFDDASREHQRVLQSRQFPLQLWDANELLRRLSLLKPEEPAAAFLNLRQYQEDAVKTVFQTFSGGQTRKAFVVMATGLGKTVVAAETIRRIKRTGPLRILVLAHTNTLVYQLERAFWPFLTAQDETRVWNGIEHPHETVLGKPGLTFACIDTAANTLLDGKTLPEYDIIIIDECHHAGAAMYGSLIRHTRAGEDGGPFLLGLTATPWRPDGNELDKIFGPPLVTIDMVKGLRNGFLANIDYRMYVDNINWNALPALAGARLSPRQINRTLFITEWDEAVVLELKKVWETHPTPRAIVFCGTIDHAITMRDRINSYGFCNAGAIYSGTAAGRSMQAYERNRMLSDFHDGQIGAICVVDIFNEGVDVPDVNIIVFQRVTHSRRIFVQQLGRGLRLAPNKEKVIVLDFVSDIRRFAAGLELKDAVEESDNRIGPLRIRLNHKVTFNRAGMEDKESESFLRTWLDDIAAVGDAADDAAVLSFPPLLQGGRK